MACSGLGRARGLPVKERAAGRVGGGLGKALIENQNGGSLHAGLHFGIQLQSQNKSR